MKRKGKQTLMPKLRFPEFLGAQAWKERPLSDVLSEHGHKSTGTEQVFSVSVHKGLINQIEHLGRSFAASSTDHYNRVLPGDIVYTKSPTGDFPFGIIKQSKHDDSVIVSPLYGVFSPETTALGLMLDAYFESPANAKRFLEPLVQKGAKNTINIKNGRFLSGTLVLPLNKEEQQKIAECLSSLDGLISAEGRMLDALKAHKKGLMQQLFPQPGQTQPRLRFPEFRGEGEWVAVILGDVVSISKGKGIAKSDLVDGGRTPCIRYAELYTIYGEVITDVRSRTNVRVDRLVLSQAGDVIIPASGETKEDIATCGCVMNAGVALGSDLNVLRSDIDGRFFSYYLNGMQRRELAKVAQGDTVAHLYPAQISRLSISIAQEPDEQQKIAACLTALDTRIAAQAAKIEALKTHKRGLMQQLFPAPEEP